MKTVLFNNKFVSEVNAKISILSESFQRGYGVFETLRTYKNKQLFKEKKHIERLFKSAKKIEIKIKYSKNEVHEMLKKVVKKSSHQTQRLKIIAIKEGIIIISTPFKDNKTLAQGVSLMSYRSLRSLPEIKSISYLPSVLAHEKAIKKGFYDALLIDEKGEVYEGAYCNIFWFEGNTLCTRKDKILEGITRKTVLEISPYKTKFKTIKLKDLLKKGEIFITQSTRGIIPVSKIDRTKIGIAKTKDKTNQLTQKFNNLITNH